MKKRTPKKQDSKSCKCMMFPLLALPSLLYISQKQSLLNHTTVYLRN